MSWLVGVRFTMRHLVDVRDVRKKNNNSINRTPKNVYPSQIMSVKFNFFVHSKNVSTQIFAVFFQYQVVTSPLWFLNITTSYLVICMCCVSSKSGTDWTVFSVFSSETPPQKTASADSLVWWVADRPQLSHHNSIQLRFFFFYLQD